MEIMSVIDRDHIVNQKNQWIAEIRDTQGRIDTLQQEITALQGRLPVLDGACQACDVFLRLIDDKDKGQGTVNG